MQIQNCSLHFGGIKALTQLSFQLAERELLGIIGPNGAGKTSFFNILSGVYSPSEGEISFQRQSLIHFNPHQISRLGIARTFQNIRLFQNLSVQDNVRIAFHPHIEASLFSSVLKLDSFVNEEKQIQKKTFDLLELFGLLEKRLELAKNLCYGDQRRLEIVRALATNPKLLLLDEPAAGMNLSEKNELMQLIRGLHQDHGLAIILIEHDMHVVMNLCPRILVLNYGTLLAEGSSEHIRNHPQVIEAYLGDRNRKPVNS
ncbi:MAG: ABC transporter ATP-binding protein [Deltaproteobacteria bacterium]|nr:ABC transporter ATP-binding protein [Deltaproteobacteria bacterium]